MSKIYFISGHGDLTREEFDEHYVKRINDIVNDDSEQNINFIIGDSLGCDFLAQKHLNKLSKKNPNIHKCITIYYGEEEPQINLGNFRSIQVSDEDVDAFMTNSSTDDILWIRQEKPQKSKLGNKYNVYHLNRPAKNMLRRNNQI